MSSAPHNPRPQPVEKTLEPGAPAPERSLHAELLERVLAATERFMQHGEGKSTSSELVGRIIKLARRHQGQELALDPVVIELVQIVLAQPFQDFGLTPEAWQRMTTEIATTLYEDPQARSRLEGLWKRLGAAP